MCSNVVSELLFTQNSCEIVRHTLPRFQVDNQVVCIDVEQLSSIRAVYVDHFNTSAACEIESVSNWINDNLAHPVTCNEYKS